MTNSINGKCCGCGYCGEEETPCQKREDGIHCEHWWEGNDMRQEIQSLTDELHNVRVEKDAAIRQWKMLEEFLDAHPSHSIASQTREAGHKWFVVCHDDGNGVVMSGGKSVPEAIENFRPGGE